MTETHKERIRLALKGRKFPLRYGDNHPNKRPEVRAKLSKTLKGRFCPWLLGENNPTKRLEVAKKISLTHKGKPCPWMIGENNPMRRPEVAKKVNESKRGKKRLDMHGEKHFIHRPGILQKIMLSNNIKPNKKELQLSNMLQELQPNNWQFVGDGKVIIEGFCPDFINVNGKKLIIELNGEYWHRNSQEKDQRKIKAYASKGFNTLTIWENELKDEIILKEKILNFTIG